MNVSAIRVLAGSILAIVLTAVAVEQGGVIMGTATRGGQELGAMPLAIPAFWALILCFLLSILCRALGRFRLLNRGEQLCVLFAALMAAPLISVGFWRFLIPTVGSFPRSEDFRTIDTLHPKLWPHGPNLTEGLLRTPGSPQIETRGKVRWETITLANGEIEVVPVLESAAAEGEINLRVHIPVERKGKAGVVPGQLYLLSVLARAEHLDLGAAYYGRLYYDGSSERDVEVFTSTKEGDRTFLQPDSFRRTGSYGIELPVNLKSGVTIEMGLQGAGRLALRDLQFLNVEALEGAYRGREVVREEDSRLLSETEAAGLPVRPENLLSFAGFRYLAIARIPWKEWMQPLLAWGSYLILILMGTFAIAVIMRREWIDNQRFPLPLAQIPLFLLGGRKGLGQFDDAEGAMQPTTGGESRRAFARLRRALGDGLPENWSSRALWGGFAVAFAWCLLRGWHDFNPAVPDTDINLRLLPYFEDPNLRPMLAPVRFEVLGVILGMAVFLELNVLMSLILGYFLFRAQYWFGELQGLTFRAGYPHADHQQLTGYLVYACLLVFLTRKYLARYIRGALRGESRKDDILSNRGALLLLLSAFGGAAGWAYAMEMPIGSMLLLFAVVVSIGFVAMKLRAECGVPSYAFFPTFVAVIVGMTGGMEMFGAQGTMFAIFVSVILGAYAFFLIPGLQMEFLELARIARLKRRMIFLVNGLAVAGGLLIGGWIFLSGVYSTGIDWFPDNADFKGPLGQKSRYYNRLHTDAMRDMEAAQAPSGSVQTTAPEPAGEEPVKKEIGLSTWCSLYAAGLTALVTLLRHAFAGFWFHPIGIVLGPMPGLQEIWGSLLVAWIVRCSFLKLGGAASVREKLLPAAAGIFLACVVAQGIFFLINVYLFHFTQASVFQVGLF